MSPKSQRRFNSTRLPKSKFDFTWKAEVVAPNKKPSGKLPLPKVEAFGQTDPPSTVVGEDITARSKPRKIIALRAIFVRFKLVSFLMLNVYNVV